MWMDVHAYRDQWRTSSITFYPSPYYYPLETESLLDTEIGRQTASFNDLLHHLSSVCVGVCVHIYT